MELVSELLKERILQVDGDDDVGVQIALENVGGQVVENAAIDQVVAVAVLHRWEDAGNGDGGAHGLGQRPGGKGDRSEGVQVRGHAAKRNGKLVEVQLLAVVVGQVAGRGTR